MTPVYLSLTSTAENAGDLGYLLHKHPDRVQQFDISAGTAQVFYPEASSERCTVGLFCEIDPITLVRRERSGKSSSVRTLGEYVNDRPYASASMLAVALGKVFRTAMSGRCDARPDLVGRALPLEVRVPVLPSVGGAALVGEFFEPLGWTVQASALPLDETVPAWGESRYLDVTLRAELVLAEALSHLYVLLPVLDSRKHYWVSADEIDKLLRAAGGWLPTHPARESITRRYLAHRRSFVATATERLAELDDQPGDEPELTEPPEDTGPTEAVQPSSPLAVERTEAVLAALREVGAHRVIDFGCGEGRLLVELIKDASITELVGADVSPGALDRAERRLRLDRMPERQRERLRLLQSSATYRDDRLTGYDAVVLMEVIEHLDLDRLPDLESAVFGHARPAAVIITTPNAEYNALYPQLSHGTVRHADHRFEWTRSEFAAWSGEVAARHGYAVEWRDVGVADPELGAPTQLALFTREARA